MAKKKSQSALERVKAKLDKTTAGRNKYFKPKQGTTTIRILPPIGDMEDFFWQNLGTHHIPDTRKVFVCPNFTLDDDDPCPICEYVAELYSSGDKASEKLAGEIRVRRKYAMNIIVRGQENRGVQIYTPGITVFAAISALVHDGDYGEIYDEYEGFDLKLTRKGSGIETEYTIVPRPRESALSDDDAEMEQWLDDAKDLYPAMLSMDPAEDAEWADAPIKLMPYDRIEAEFEGVLPEPDEEPEEPWFEEGEEGDDEEEEVDVRAAIKKRRKSRTDRRRRR